MVGNGYTTTETISLRSGYESSLGQLAFLQEFLGSLDESARPAWTFNVVSIALLVDYMIFREADSDQVAQSRSLGR